MKYYYLVEGDLRNNVGDVLQGMVAAPFLPEDAQPVDREATRELQIEEDAFLLANGWYMHHFDSFPPPPNVTPLYISVHIADSKMLKIKRIRDHFKEHAPIGCRDRKTEKLFLGWGIPAYYSGCLTVTTQKRAPIENITGEALLVDNVDHQIPEEVKEKIELLLGKSLKRVSHDPEFTTGSFDNYVIEGKKQMNTLLKRYCEAEVIVTTKIHCTLPCLGMGANVILIHPNPGDPRLETVREFMPIYSFKDILGLDVLQQPAVDTERLAARKNILSAIAKDSVAEGRNIIKHSNKPVYKKIRRSSKRNAKLYRLAVKIMLTIGVKKEQLQKVYSV